MDRDDGGFNLRLNEATYCYMIFTRLSKGNVYRSFLASIVIESLYLADQASVAGSQDYFTFFCLSNADDLLTTLSIGSKNAFPCASSE